MSSFKVEIMKKVLLSIIALLCSIVAFSENRLQIVIDYKNGIYQGYTYDKIIVEEKDFLKDRHRYEGRFYEEFQNNYKGVAYMPDVVNEDEPVLKIEILQVTRKGDLQANVIYGDQTTTMQAEGGTFGTFLNLFGDGMEHLGKQVGKWMKKAAK